MTYEEVKTLTGQEYEYYATDADGCVIFCLPFLIMQSPCRVDTDYEPDCPDDLLDMTPDYMPYWTDENGELQFPGDPVETARYLEMLWNAYICSLQKRKNRTRKQAQQSGAITALPKELALPTLKSYQNAISTVNDPVAHLQPIISDLADNLRFENGVLYFQDVNASRVDLVRYYDKRPQAVSDLDLTTLRVLYAVILQDVRDMAKDPEKIIAQTNESQYLSHSVKIYLPDFLQMLGYKQNGSKDGVKFAIAKIMSYNRILGVMREYKGGREYASHYPVMVFMGYDATRNTLHFASPYINKLIMTILQASIQTDRKGRPRLKSNGQPFMLPSHSFLVKSSIAKERNKRAAEIVCIVVTLIEQAGSSIPHIRAQTIVDRCPDLKNALDAASSSNKSLILKRAFTKAWELLPKQTRLTEVYKNIHVPDIIPSASTLDTVLEFRHEGKVKPATQKN